LSALISSNGDDLELKYITEKSDEKNKLRDFIFASCQIVAVSGGVEAIPN
jgi:hypothetical protein